MKHYIVATDVNIPGDAILDVAAYLESIQESFPDTKFKITGAINKHTKKWFAPTGVETDEDKFSEQDVMEQMVEILSTSPFRTTDEVVIDALESRRRPDLKLAYQHMHWLYTTSDVTKDNINIWCDSIFEGEIDIPGITNICTEYESDSETTFMVAVEVDEV